jgi:hypothetical protein
MTATTDGHGLRALCYASAAYDLLLAVPLLLAPVATARLFGAPVPQPVVNAQLNGVFTLTLAVGYLWAARRDEVRRGYLWLAGVLAKSLGVVVFVLDHVLRGSPRSFLLFACTDGAVAVASLVLLLRARGAGAPPQ